jgi:hypothetical protein
MDLNLGIESTLAWADTYEDSENLENVREESDDETVETLTAAHELWMAMLKTWAGSPPQGDHNADACIISIGKYPF